MPVIEIPSPLTIDELHAQINAHMESPNYEIRERRYWDGSSECRLTKDGHVRATWRSRLVRIPKIDEPRGPSEYYDLKFYPLPNQ